MSCEDSVHRKAGPVIITITVRLCRQALKHFFSGLVGGWLVQRLTKSHRTQPNDVAAVSGALHLSSCYENIRGRKVHLTPTPGHIKNRKYVGFFFSYYKATSLEAV